MSYSFMLALAVKLHFHCLYLRLLWNCISFYIIHAGVSSFVTSYYERWLFPGTS